MIFLVSLIPPTVETSNVSNAGTDGSVNLNIFGSLGDTRPRKLKTSNENWDKFETGRTDTFQIDAIDVGEMNAIELNLKKGF